VLVEERRLRILQVLDEAGTLSTEQLAQRLEVSAETIRRDLVQLDQQGRLQRVHGGAMNGAAVRQEEPPFAERAGVAAEAKRRIAQVASGLVTPGQTVAFDIGTTVLAVARALPGSFHGTVVTCSLLVAAELAGRAGVEVLVAGGRVRGGDLAVSNAQMVEFFRDVHTDVAFLGSGGVAPEAGLTDFYVDEVVTRRVIIANASAAYVLADASKLGKVAAHRVCGLDDVTAVVTDQRPPRSLAGAIREAGGRLLMPA
jgi:DeoR family transcriptional regulator, fructose operon transcriptional repressor